MSTAGSSTSSGSKSKNGSGFATVISLLALIVSILSSYYSFASHKDISRIETIRKQYEYYYEFERLEIENCDLGCGTGRYLPTLAEKFKTIYAIDISAKCLSLNLTPKAWANFRPGFRAEREPWVNNQKSYQTLKRVWRLANPFRVTTQ